ncbi:alpha/beta fold hydrolase [Citricoccus sp. SGAir0253]|uniref:alpha/beta fold hydrolase n=1 Tax=Citricoccus sp. SGAir0253 TaxID=2567881 RepID=UPI0010CD3877|nr:alpha/beta fold hydrolase [Citricoccus sp. SGAir0253]QCU77131.1 alpha/beta fold hydrolase [Citricoccus sp. SGAir0253]
MHHAGGLPPVEYAHLLGAGRDGLRQWSGRLLDHAGAAPRTTPSVVSDPAPGVRLHAYPASDAGSRSSPAPEAGPPVLLVPAPIKRHYIWDLEPAVSVVAACHSAGLRVFLAEWTEPGTDQQHWGLEQYADTLLLACTREVLRQTGAASVALAGHSLGGTLAAIFSVRRPELVAGLVLLEAPVHFGADAGALAPVVAAAPHAGWLRPRHRGVPGSFLDLVSASASPREFGLEPYLDRAASLANPTRLATHWRVQRWMLDEFAMPGQLFEDVVEHLYRRDELMGGTLAVAGERVGPSRLTAPLLSVVDPRSSIVPPRSILPFHDAAASTGKRVLRYRGDIGVGLQHVGVLVGRSAHRELWPEILRWMTGVRAAER